MHLRSPPLCVCRERQEAAEEQERERSEMQQIDWHDFVVVETIDFFDDEDLPPPLTLQDLLTLRKAQEVGEAEAAAEKPREVAGAGAGVRMDAEEAAMVREASGAGRSAGVTGGTGGVVVVDDAAPLRVVRDYQREIRGRGMDPTQYVVSPLTGEIVAVRDMEEHMRVSLIDPRWRQQKEAMLSKLRDTTRANDEEITSNLMTLAKVRGARDDAGQGEGCTGCGSVAVTRGSDRATEHMAKYCVVLW